MSSRQSSGEADIRAVTMKHRRRRTLRLQRGWRELPESEKHLRARKSREVAPWHISGWPAPQPALLPGHRGPDIRTTTAICTSAPEGGGARGGGSGCRASTAERPSGSVSGDRKRPLSAVRESVPQGSTSSFTAIRRRFSFRLSPTFGNPLDIPERRTSRSNSARRWAALAAPSDARSCVCRTLLG